MRPKFECINIGEEDELFVVGYRLSKLGIILFVILVVLSGGLLLLSIVWKPSLRVKITHRRSALDEASIVVVKVSQPIEWSQLSCLVIGLKDRFGDEFVEKVETPVHGVNIAGNCIHFYHKKVKYIWRSELNQFVKLRSVRTRHQTTAHCAHCALMP